MSIRSESLTRDIKCGRVDHVYQVRDARLVWCPEVLVVERLWRPLLGVDLEPNPGKNKNKLSLISLIFAVRRKHRVRTPSFVEPFLTFDAKCKQGLRRLVWKQSCGSQCRSQCH